MDNDMKEYLLKMDIEKLFKVKKLSELTETYVWLTKHLSDIYIERRREIRTKKKNKED